MKLLVEQEIKEAARRRATINICAVLIGSLTMFLCFGLAKIVLNILPDVLGRPAAGVVATGVFVGGIAIFLTSCVLAEKFAKKYSLVCPACAIDLTRFTPRVLATRCCHRCGERIVEGGRTHRSEVYDRLSQIRMRRFLVYLFWAWPAMALVVLAEHWRDPSSLDRCLQVLFVPALVGTAAAGWGLLRIRDRRYLPSFVASAVLLGIGGWVFWKAFW